MSEQPTSNVYDTSDYHPEREGTVVDAHSGEVRTDLHRNNTVPKYDPRVVEAGRLAFESYEKPVPDPSPVEIAGFKLYDLNQAREAMKLPEDKRFLADDRNDSFTENAA